MTQISLRLFKINNLLKQYVCDRGRLDSIIRPGMEFANVSTGVRMPNTGMSINRVLARTDHAPRPLYALTRIEEKGRKGTND